MLSIHRFIDGTLLKTGLLSVVLCNVGAGGKKTETVGETLFLAVSAILRLPLIPTWHRLSPED